MSDDQENDDKDKLRSTWQQKAETYGYCKEHSRRYPHGADCPNCVAEAKKKKPK
jgi:hypothetical protein